MALWTQLRTLRYVFAEFSSVDEANIAIASLNGTHFDKSHALFANRFTDIEKFANMDEGYVEPEIEPYEAKVSRCQFQLFMPGSTTPILGASTILAG